MKMLLSFPEKCLTLYGFIQAYKHWLWNTKLTKYQSISYLKIDLLSPRISSSLIPNLLRGNCLWKPEKCDVYQPQRTGYISDFPAMGNFLLLRMLQCPKQGVSVPVSGHCTVFRIQFSYLESKAKDMSGLWNSLKMKQLALFKMCMVLPSEGTLQKSTHCQSPHSPAGTDVQGASQPVLRAVPVCELFVSGLQQGRWGTGVSPQKLRANCQGVLNLRLKIYSL